MTNTAKQDKCRASFETQMRKLFQHCIPGKNDGTGDYINEGMQCYWTLWQAARADMLAELEGEAMIKNIKAVIEDGIITRQCQPEQLAKAALSAVAERLKA